MDLNVDNYSLPELLTILNAPEKDINITILQQCLYDKMEQIKDINDEQLSENKEYLMEFYTKAMFKLLKNIALLNTTKKDSTIIRDFEKTVENSFDSNEQKAAEFINVKENLLPPLQSGSVVEQNNSFVVRHTDLKAVNTFNSNLKYGEVNPLTRKSLKRVVNINTKFRNNYTTTVSTNFSLELPSTIKKVVSMKLVDTQFPEMVYTVSSKLGSNLFIIDNSYIDISNGSYSSESIVTEINKHISTFNKKLSYNENDGLMTFTDLSGESFDLDFNYIPGICPQVPSNINKDQLTLGWLLGFRGNYLSKINATISNKLYKVRTSRPSIKQNNYLKNNIQCCSELIKNEVDISNIYTGNSSYTGESLFDPHGTRYFLISINDFHNNHDNAFVSPFQFQTLADNNIIAKISTECCYKCCIEHPERIYFGPTDITKLEIKIYDEYGRIIDINNADYSLTLELEVIYDL